MTLLSLKNWFVFYNHKVDNRKRDQEQSDQDLLTLLWLQVFLKSFECTILLPVKPSCKVNLLDVRIFTKCKAMIRI